VTELRRLSTLEKRRGSAESGVVSIALICSPFTSGSCCRQIEKNIIAKRLTHVVRISHGLSLLGRIRAIVRGLRKTYPPEAMPRDQVLSNGVLP
jgi:hypothetical protein